MMEITPKEVFRLINRVYVPRIGEPIQGVLAYHPAHDEYIQNRTGLLRALFGEPSNSYLILWVSTVFNSDGGFWYGTSAELGVYLHSIGMHEAYGGYNTWCWNEALKQAAIRDDDAIREVTQQ